MKFKRPINAIERAHADSSVHTCNNSFTTRSIYCSVPTEQVIINTDNIRQTFKSLLELDAYVIEIGFPSTTFSDDTLASPLDWLDEHSAHMHSNYDAFTKIVNLALSIKTQGQLQPAGAVKRPDGKYHIIYGSTRAMAVHLIGLSLDIKIIEDRDKAQRMKQQLIENLQRSDLTFAETADGYLRLFQILLDTGDINRISRKYIMEQLLISRAWAGKWSAVLNKALQDCDYKALILSGDIKGLTPAYELIRENRPIDTSTTDAAFTTPTHQQALPGNRPVKQSSSSRFFSSQLDKDSIDHICWLITRAIHAELDHLKQSEHPLYEDLQSIHRRFLPIKSLIEAEEAARSLQQLTLQYG